MKKYFLTALLGLLFVRCGSDDALSTNVEIEAAKERSVKKRNLEIAQSRAENDKECDTLDLEEFIIDNYPPGSHLMFVSRKSVYDVPTKAVIYHKDKCNRFQYVLAVIVESKECERLVEPNNLVGYEASFINFDSTKLGTALFNLTLFECSKNGLFNKVWEKFVPSQGGFVSMKLKRWKPYNVEYVELKFSDGIISGSRNYNYFFMDGIENLPHLIETYEGIGHKRTLADHDKNLFPDYYEYRFSRKRNKISIRDSIPFYWNSNNKLYVTKINKNWFRKY